MSGEHQMELLDFVAAKFHEEGGVFKLLASDTDKTSLTINAITYFPNILWIIMDLFFLRL